MVTTAPNDGVPDDDDASGTSGSSRSSPMTLSADGSHVVAVPLPSTPEWLQPGAHVSKQLSDGSIVDGIVGPLTDAEGRVVEGSRCCRRAFCWELDVELLELKTMAELIASGDLVRGDSSRAPPRVEFVVRTTKGKPRLAGALLGSNDSLFDPQQPAYLNFSVLLKNHSDGWRCDYDWLRDTYRTFRVGDVVKNENGDEASVARVLTAQWPPPPSPSTQWRNILVLYEHGVDEPGFFIGGWSRWKRVETEAASEASSAAWAAWSPRRGAADDAADAAAANADGGDESSAMRTRRSTLRTSAAASGVVARRFAPPVLAVDPKADVVTLTTSQLEAMEAALRQSAIRNMKMSTVVSRAKAADQTPPAAKTANAVAAASERKAEQQHEAEMARLDAEITAADAEEEQTRNLWVAAKARAAKAREAKTAALKKEIEEFQDAQARRMADIRAAARAKGIELSPSPSPRDRRVESPSPSPRGRRRSRSTSPSRSRSRPPPHSRRSRTKIFVYTCELCSHTHTATDGLAAATCGGRHLPRCGRRGVDDAGGETRARRRRRGLAVAASRPRRAAACRPKGTCGRAGLAGALDLLSGGRGRAGERGGARQSAPRRPRGVA